MSVVIQGLPRTRTVFCLQHTCIQFSLSLLKPVSMLSCCSHQCNRISFCHLLFCLMFYSVALASWLSILFCDRVECFTKNVCFNYHLWDSINCTFIRMWDQYYWEWWRRFSEFVSTAARPRARTIDWLLRPTCYSLSHLN